MNCREAERQIFAERDGALEELQRAALAAHLDSCAGCRQQRDHLAAVMVCWRKTAATIAVPDAQREWLDVRRRMRGGVVAGETRPAATRRWVAWLALPVTAAAALAIALWSPEEVPARKAPAVATPPAQTIARNDAVDVSAADGSVVFVDDKSGWVVVWDGDAKRI